MDAIFLSLRFLFHGLFVESLVNFGERDGKNADEDNFFGYQIGMFCSWFSYLFQFHYEKMAHL